MQIENVIAYRNGQSITVLVMGNLPRSCDSAQIVDVYPGGDIQYVRDPGYAQVFIEFTSSPELCPTLLTPWLSQVEIEDKDHNEIEVFVDKKSVYKTVINQEMVPAFLRKQ